MMCSDTNQNPNPLEIIDENGLKSSLPELPYFIISRNEDSQKVFNILNQKSSEDCKHRVVITGVSGIGKTTFAIYYGKKWGFEPGTRFENVAFLKAGNELSFRKSFINLASQIGVDKSLAYTEKLRQFKEFYANNYSKTLLLILDDLNNNNVFLKNYLDSLPSNIHIIATSENNNFDNNFIEYKLKNLCVDEGFRLVRSILGLNFLKLSKEFEVCDLFKKLVIKFNGLPLALTQVISYIKVEIDFLRTFDYVLGPYLIKKAINKYLQIFNKISSSPHQLLTENNFDLLNAVRVNLEKVIEIGKDLKNNIIAEILAVMSHLNSDIIEKKMLIVLFGEDNYKFAIAILKKFNIVFETTRNKTIFLNIHTFTKSVTRIILQTVDWQSKIALYSIFDKNYISYWHRLDLKQINLNCIAFDKNFVQEVIDRAFIAFENNVKESLEVLRKTGYKGSNSKWPTPHKLFLASCTDITIFNNEIIINILKCISNLKVVTEDQLTVLHMALTKTLDENIVKYLIEQGISINATTVDNVSLLHVLVAFGPSVETAFHLIVRPEWPQFRQYTSLISLKLLWNHETDSIQNNDGDTAQHILAKTWKNGTWYQAYFYILESLIISGFDKLNNNGDLPVHTAVIYRHITTLNEMDTGFIDSKSSPPIFYFKHYFDMPNSEGDTAYHLAVRDAVTTSDEIVIKSKIIPILKLMKSSRARMDIKNNIGETVVDLPLKYGQKYLSDWLKKPKPKEDGFISCRDRFELDWDADKKLYYEKVTGI